MTYNVNMNETESSLMRKLIRTLVPEAMRRRIGARSKYCESSFSQEGEDRILAVLLGLPERTRPGFYVDVGAHHPERYSNTCLFYERGWTGINIDAMPGSMREFAVRRPRDINLEVAIASCSSTLTFFEFNVPALNGFSKELALEREKVPGFYIVGERKIDTRPLSSVLEEHIPVGGNIDFMSVDVEGLDFDVLQSNDWVKFRPAVVLVEDGNGYDSMLGDVTDIGRYLGRLGYKLCSKTPLTSFFVDESQIVVNSFGIRVRLKEME